jgi:hypothetical protein
MIYYRARTRCRRALEHLFKAHPLEVLESVVEYWYRNETVNTSNSHVRLVLNNSTQREDSGSLELVDILTSSAQNVVHMLCETITVRIPDMSDRPRRHILCPTA